jgi:hypothetical protein
VRENGKSKNVCNDAATDDIHPFATALKKIATADAASSRAAIQASKATKPSLHTRFVHDPAKDRG